MFVHPLGRGSYIQYVFLGSWPYLMSGLLGLCWKLVGFLFWLMWLLWLYWFISGLLGLCNRFISDLLGLCVLLVYGPNLLLCLFWLGLCLWCLLLDVLDLVDWWLHPCCGGSTLLVISSLSSVTSITDSVSSEWISLGSWFNQDD